ncbi:hypothetical protein [Iamia sp.]|uniref:hypothetical protein n=1 Tax=Iamia sp. TaxID=2722710 RepID=UPI002C4C7A80|nr:hypothetical protein [Iamia sp.]HXH56585.1 hypothetical protein [Iamia sp.]
MLHLRNPLTDRITIAEHNDAIKRRNVARLFGGDRPTPIRVLRTEAPYDRLPPGCPADRVLAHECHRTAEMVRERIAVLDKAIDAAIEADVHETEVDAHLAALVALQALAIAAEHLTPR